MRAIACAPPCQKGKSWSRSLWSHASSPAPVTHSRASRRMLPCYANGIIVVQVHFCSQPGGDANRKLKDIVLHEKRLRPWSSWLSIAQSREESWQPHRFSQPVATLTFQSLARENKRCYSRSQPNSSQFWATFNRLPAKTGVVTKLGQLFLHWPSFFPSPDRDECLCNLKSRKRHTDPSISFHRLTAREPVATPLALTTSCSLISFFQSLARERASCNSYRRTHIGHA